MQFKMVDDDKELIIFNKDEKALLENTCGLLQHLSRRLEDRMPGIDREFEEDSHDYLLSLLFLINDVM